MKEIKVNIFYHGDANGKNWCTLCNDIVTDVNGDIIDIAGIDSNVISDILHPTNEHTIKYVIHNSASEKIEDTLEKFNIHPNDIVNIHNKNIISFNIYVEDCTIIRLDYTKSVITISSDNLFDIFIENPKDFIKNDIKISDLINLICGTIKNYELCQNQKVK